ncbi:hypothetical protein P4574_29590 [Priestia megaterium]|uniref:hypothetical protein n=1 Tax=Priestia megaterium TaxID=1404 RepID=UPI002E23CD3F|nr:hypothetical protein [Priestia megaterium]
MNKEKTSKTLIVFGILLIITVLSTLLFLCLSKYDPNQWHNVLLSFGSVSLVGVAFLIYIKEVRVKEKWSEMPRVGKFIFWSMFVIHSLNFFDQFMTVLIFQ